MPPPPAADRSASSLAALRERHGPNYRWKVLATVVIGTVAAILSSTIVNVAVPDLSRHFGLGQERAQWVAAGFMAAMTLAMLPTPWLLARFGYRRTFSAAVLALGCGGAIGGLAAHYPLVLAMRVLEGLAAGVLQPIPAIIVMRAFGPGEQGRAMGIFGFGVVLAPALGPSVGGVLVELFGWRSIFFVVLPFCVLALGLAWRYLPNSAPGGVAADRQLRLDVTGLALASGATLALLNGLAELGQADRRIAFALLAAAAALLLAFVLHQRRRARRGLQPLLALPLFKGRVFAAGSLVAFIYGMALFGSTYLVPVFMQTGLQFPPSEAGFVLLPAGIVLALTIPLAGRLADRWPVHAMVAAGLILLAASFALMTAVGTGTALWIIAAMAVLGRLGLGLVLPSLNLGALRGVQAAQLAQAASAISFVRQLGGAVGVSLVGIFFESRLAARGTGHALSAFGDTFWLVAAICALAAMAALRMRDGAVLQRADPAAEAPATQQELGTTAAIAATATATPDTLPEEPR